MRAPLTLLASGSRPPAPTLRSVVDIRSASSPSEVEAAGVVLDAVLGSGRGYQSSRKAWLELWRADPELVLVAEDAGKIVGAAGCANSGVNALGVAEASRGQGIGGRLLEHAEALLRARGATAASLGSLDGAVDFYLRHGYIPQLLIQFAPEANDPDSIITELLRGLLAGRDVFRKEWQGHPQLWLQERSIDWDLKQQVEGVAPGVVAQYIMSKPL